MRAARHLRQHRILGVAPDEIGRRAEVEQTLQDRGGHRPDDDVAADDDAVDALSRDVFEHGLERRQVAVDVVDRGYAHGAIIRGVSSRARRRRAGRYP